VLGGLGNFETKDKLSTLLKKSVSVVDKAFCLAITILPLELMAIIYEGSDDICLCVIFVLYSLTGSFAAIMI
jgi:hypothetical protein